VGDVQKLAPSHVTDLLAFTRLPCMHHE